MGVKMMGEESLVASKWLNKGQQAENGTQEVPY